MIVIGDSIGFGFCTDDESLPVESIFPNQLEKRLNSVDVPGIHKFEVINLSVSGYDTIQEVEFLYQKGLELDPDFVIVAYCLNDAWTASAELVDFRQHASWFESHPLLPRVVATLFRMSHLARLVWQRSSILLSRTRNTPDIDPPAIGLTRLRSLADLHQFDVMVTIFALFEDFKHYPRKSDHERIWKEAMKNQFDVVDLFDAFRVKSKGNPKALQGPCNREHPDEKGHLVAAEMIEQYMLTRVIPNLRH
jgi:hypothetical protein